MSMLVFGQIWIRLEIGISITTILGFQYWASTWLRYQWFGNRLDDEPWIGTPICQSLVTWLALISCLTGRETYRQFPWQKSITFFDQNLIFFSFLSVNKRHMAKEKNFMKLRNLICMCFNKIIFSLKHITDV